MSDMTAEPDWWRDLMRERFKPVPERPRETAADRQKNDIDQLIGLLADLMEGK